MEDLELKEMVRKNLIKYRKNKGLSQKEAAEAADISRTLLSAYEVGRAKPTKENLEKLAEIYGTDVDAIMETNMMLLRYSNYMYKTWLGFEPKENIPNLAVHDINNRIQKFFSAEEQEGLKTDQKDHQIPLFSKISNPDFIYIKDDIEKIIHTDSDADFAFYYGKNNQSPTIKNGDLLLIKQYNRSVNTFENGSWVFTYFPLKDSKDPIFVYKFFKKKDFYVLHSDNTDIQPIFIQEHQIKIDVFFIGKVVESRRMF